MKLFFILFCVFILSPLQAQNDSLEVLLETATLEFRGNILESSDKYHELEELTDRWESIEKDTQVLDYLFYNISYSVEVLDMSTKEIKKQSKSALPKSPLSKKINKNDIKIFRNHSELISLMASGNIEAKSPFKPILDPLILKQLEFVTLQLNETIADIGSGNGNKTFIMSLIYPKNDFILTEIDKDLIKCLKKKLKKHENILLKNDRTIEIIKGSKSDLKLGKKVDKVILSDTFHHFSKKRKMMKSIENHLNDDGTLYIIENLKPETPSIISCSKAMEYEKICELIRKTNFKIVKEEIVDNCLFLACKIN